MTVLGELHFSGGDDNTSLTILLAFNNSKEKGQGEGNLYKIHHTICAKPYMDSGNLYLWGGWMDGIPRVQIVSRRQSCCLVWTCFKYTVGTGYGRRLISPPLGVSGYCCTAVGDSLYYYGGYCGHYGLSYNVHKLSTPSLQWTMLSPSKSERGAPIDGLWYGSTGMTRRTSCV